MSRRGKRSNLGPGCDVPVERTVDHVAELFGARRRLDAELGVDGQRVAAAAGHLVDALDGARLDAAAARLAARREVGDVPARRARHVVAGPRDGVRPPGHVAQQRTHRFVVALAHALDDRLLHS